MLLMPKGVRPHADSQLGHQMFPERFICPLEIKQRPQLVQISSSGFKNEPREWCENHVLKQDQENKRKAL